MYQNHDYPFTTLSALYPRNILRDTRRRPIAQQPTLVLQTHHPKHWGQLDCLQVELQLSLSRLYSVLQLGRGRHGCLGLRALRALRLRHESRQVAFGGSGADGQPVDDEDTPGNCVGSDAGWKSQSLGKLSCLTCTGWERGKLTVKRANGQTHPAKLTAVHDVELRHVAHSRQHDQRAPNEAFPQQRANILVHRAFQAPAVRLALKRELPLLHTLLHPATEPAAEPVRHAQQAMEIQHRSQ
jgi:hypothetical protein